MGIFFLICAAGILAAAVLLALSRTVLFLSYRDKTLIVSLTVLRCGVIYDERRDRAGIVCGPFTYYFAPSEKKPKKKKAEKDKKAAKKKRARKRKRMPVGIIMRIAKAAVVFLAETLSRIRYDDGRLDVVPVIADPALAGMTYGWGQALYGAFPGLQRTIGVTPAFGRGKTEVSGHLRLSIRNGSVIGPLWRLLRNLPIIKILHYRFIGRGG